MKDLATNKRARFDYDILSTYEAGLVLTGQEVKSVKTGHMSLKGAFVTLHNNELYLTNAMIPRYEHASPTLFHDPHRSRKLLLKRSEISALIGKKKTDGLTLVPIRVYTKRRYIKLLFGVGRGKKRYDKRQTIKKKEDDRKKQRAFRDR